MPTSNRAFTVSLDGSAAYYRVKGVAAPIRVGPLPDGEMALATGQLIRNVGASLQFSGRPVDVTRSPNGQRLYLKKNDGIVVVDVTTWSLLQQLSFPGSGASMHGIVVSQDGSRVYATGSGNELYEGTVGTNGTVHWSRTLSLPGSSYPCGIAVSADRTRAFVCLSRLNTLAVVNLETGSLIRQINVGIAPFDVVLSPDEAVAYVSDWGGRRPIAGDRTADSAGTQVVGRPWHRPMALSPWTGAKNADGLVPNGL
jgi:DNA-binding beta-propeller fold protein YncE